jgi:hypothetical protein
VRGCLPIRKIKVVVVVVRNETPQLVLTRPGCAGVGPLPPSLYLQYYHHVWTSCTLGLPNVTARIKLNRFSIINLSRIYMYIILFYKNVRVPLKKISKCSNHIYVHRD